MIKDDKKEEVEYVDYVVCQICNKKFNRITNTHLKKHNLTTNEYLDKFPFQTGRMTSGVLGKEYGDVSRNKTYEEIYGLSKANLIKQKKSEAMTEYKLIEKKCFICDKKFITKENSDKKYCSRKCQFEGLRKEKVKKVCLNCNEEFFDFPSSNKKFCSRRCFDEYTIKMSEMNQKITMSVCCSMCSKSFDTKLNKLGNKNFFCSKECRKRYSKLKRKFDYKEKAYAQYGKICDRCNSVETLLVHHKDGNRLNNDIFNLQVLCRKCHTALHKELFKIQKKFVGQADIEQGMILILTGLHKAFGLDITNENFRLTPKRFARAYYEIFEGINNKKELHNIAETSFPSSYNGMIIGKDIRVFSMCPHHFLPVEYIINVGYIPDKKTIGISKLTRVVDLLSKQPELQEMLTDNIADTLMRELKPKGVIVQVKGRHFCMIMRGVKQFDSWTLTSSIKGVFDKQKVREEFMMFIGK